MQENVVEDREVYSYLFMVLAKAYRIYGVNDYILAFNRLVALLKADPQVSLYFNENMVTYHLRENLSLQGEI